MRVVLRKFTRFGWIGCLVSAGLGLACWGWLVGAAACSAGLARWGWLGLLGLARLVGGWLGSSGLAWLAGVGVRLSGLACWGWLGLVGVGSLRQACRGLSAAGSSRQSIGGAGHLGGSEGLGSAWELVEFVRTLVEGRQKSDQELVKSPSWSRGVLGSPP